MPILSSIGGGSSRGFGGSRGIAVNPSLFSFTTHTFTSAGKVGRFGQTFSTFQSTYSAQVWASNPAWFFQGRSTGYQTWTVPTTGAYQIEAAGARGQNGGLGTAYGAIRRARVNLNYGVQLEMVVGQVPGSSGTENVVSAAGGGGGSTRGPDGNPGGGGGGSSGPADDEAAEPAGGWVVVGGRGAGAVRAAGTPSGMSRYSLPKPNLSAHSPALAKCLSLVTCVQSAVFGTLLVFRHA
jgi:hypothetical protein